MHEIDIQEVIDYAKCPMYYFFKHKAEDLKTDKINIIEKYDKDIHSVIYFAFSRVQENAGIELKDIKSSWGRVWIKDKRKSSIIFSESLMTKDTYNERRRKGLDSLFNFQREFNLNPGLPVAINKPYKVQISKNLTITGNFELIRAIDDEVQVMTFKTDEHSNTKVLKENDLRLLANGLAAREYLNNNKLTHVMYHVDKNFTTKYEDSKLNIELFKYSVTNIYKAIYNKLYYMGPDSNCYSCIYKDLCSNQNKVMQIMDKEAKKC